MKERYSYKYEQYYERNSEIRYSKPKRRTKVRKNIFPIKRFIALIFCLILLFCILPYSFNLYIKDIFPSKTLKNLKINYNNVMYPAQSMFPQSETSFGDKFMNNINYGKPLMLDIPESFQRIGLRNSLLSLAQKYKRIHPSVYVWEYNGKSYVNINADEPFPAASIIKLPVLLQMFREIENQKFSLYDTMIFEDYYRSEGSGKLKYSKSGAEHTFDHLARIMIENSDNSSTNMIVSKIGGMPKVNTAIKKWGLKTTSINNWLPDMGGTNLTTAQELAKILYNLDVTNIVSMDSKRHIADYMTHVKNTRLIKAGLPDSAILLHKTGDIGFMLGDAGIVKTINNKNKD